MKYKLAPLGLLASLACSATVTLDFQGASGLANSSGTPTNGMYYAIVVDTDNGSGFNPGLYDAFDVTVSGQFLTIAGSSTDDYYVFGTEIGITEAGPPPFFTTASLNQLAGVPYGTVVAGDSVALIWFEANSANAGDKYGFFTNAMALGSDGSTTDYSAAVGTSVKTATYTIAVPEPAHFAAALGLLSLGVILWRRRGQAVA